MLAQHVFGIVGRRVGRWTSRERLRTSTSRPSVPWPTEARFREWYDAADLAGCWRRAGVELPDPVIGPVFFAEPPQLRG